MNVTIKMNNVFPPLRVKENSGSPRNDPIVTAVACATATIIIARKEYVFIFGNSLETKKTIVYEKIVATRKADPT